MRATFSVTEAVGSGWSVLRRHPGAVVAWGLVYALMVGGMLAVMAYGLSGMLENLPETPEDLGVFDNLEWQLRMQMLMSPLNGLGLLVEGIVGAAIIRAVLAGRRGFAWVSFWVQEFLLIVIQLVVTISLCVIAIPLGILAVLLSVALWQAEPMIGLVAGTLAGGAVVALLLWLGLRLSLVGPASVATRRLAFAEGWRLSQGQTGALLMTGVLSVVVILVVEIAVFALLAVIVWAGYLAGIRIPFEEIDPQTFDPEALRPLLVPGLIALLVICLIQAFLNLLWQAPWASAYAQLSSARASSSPLESGSDSGSPSATNASDTELMQ